MAISYEKLGGIYETLGDTNIALKYYEDEVKLFEELYDSDKENTNYKNGLAMSYIKLSLPYMHIGNTQKAKEYIDKSYSIYQELTTSYPKNAEYQRNFELVKVFKQVLEELK